MNFFNNVKKLILRQYFYFADKIVAINYYLSMPEFWIYHGSEHVSGSEYARVLNMNQVLNMPGFRIYQVSKYASAFMPTLWTYEGSGYARVLSDSKCSNLGQFNILNKVNSKNNYHETFLAYICLALKRHHDFRCLWLDNYYEI